MRYVALFLLCLTPLALGCGQGQNITELGGVRITLIGKPSQMNVVDDTAKASVAGRNYDLAVANGKLTVNGSEYGPVTKGDEVKISEGKITINGKPAKPTSEAEPSAP